LKDGIKRMVWENMKYGFETQRHRDTEKST
jgi:hypothetical protein